MRMSDIDFTGLTEAVIGSVVFVAAIPSFYFIGDIALFIKHLF